MKRLSWMLMLSTTLATGALAQTPIDALRLSLLKPGGTARSTALGGAIGAVGADQGGLSINPAGIGFYRRSEITVSGLVVSTNAATNLNGNGTSEGKVNFNISNAGVVLTKLFKDHYGDPTRGKWQSFSFGLTYNKLADFNSYRVYQNPNSANSILNDYRDELNGAGLTSNNITSDNFSYGTVNAYNTYLLNPDPITDTNATQYTSVSDNQRVDQQMIIRTRGMASEVNFTFGTNYDNKLYIGGSLGIPIINYTEDITVNETARGANAAGYQGLQQTNSVNTSGAGINLKFGVIYRPVNAFRIGAAIHSPNFLKLSDDYSTTTNSYFDTVNYTYKLSNVFDYKLNTPFRNIESAAIFFKQYGFLSVDYEYANYGLARFNYSSANAAYQVSDNQAVQNTLKSTHTIRAGVELAYDVFRLRGGFAYTTSPIIAAAQINGADYAAYTYSAGLGFRFKRAFIDLSYYRYKTNTASTFSNELAANNTLKQDNFLLTLGFNFGK